MAPFTTSLEASCFLTTAFATELNNAALTAKANIDSMMDLMLLVSFIVLFLTNLNGDQLKEFLISNHNSCCLI